MHRVRLTSQGWEAYTGELAGGARFEGGVSVNKLIVPIVNRIGASLSIVDHDTGEELGPAAMLFRIRSIDMDVGRETVTADIVAQREADAEAARKAREEEEAGREAERIAAEAAALEAARLKAEAETPQVWTRLELEQLGADKGINALRDIAEPMGAKGRSVNELVADILRKQSKVLQG